jgi:hypothetical protein
MRVKVNDEDALTLVTRALRQSTPEIRTGVMEVVVGAMVDAGDWGSLMFWSSEISNAIEQYALMLARTNRAVCGHCFDGLTEELKRKLEGRVEVRR